MTSAVHLLPLPGHQLPKELVDGLCCDNLRERGGVVQWGLEVNDQCSSAIVWTQADQ
jgi:hypothetical protein